MFSVLTLFCYAKNPRVWKRGALGDFPGFVPSGGLAWFFLWPCVCFHHIEKLCMLGIGKAHIPILFFLAELKTPKRGRN